MNKTDMIAAMADKAEISKKEAEAALGGFIEALVSGVTDEGKVNLPGVGTFVKKERKATSGVMNGKPWTKEAHNVVKFSPAPAFKSAVL